MFCPRCATQNSDGARFCRSCGANISLVPMAVSGQLPESAETLEEGGQLCIRKRDKDHPPNAANAVRQFFMGLGFILVAMALAFKGQDWWFWMLIPAFSMIGSGVAMFVKARVYENQRLSPVQQQPPTLQNPQQNYASLNPRNTGELYPEPPSVTEGTTRHLGVEAPTRHFNAKPVGQEIDH
jgi:hypothetical protein